MRELAAVLGVQYRRISEIDFAHSNIITVLGPSGEIRHQQQGLGTAPDDTVAMIHKLHRTADQHYEIGCLLDNLEPLKA